MHLLLHEPCGLQQIPQQSPLLGQIGHPLHRQQLGQTTQQPQPGHLCSEVTQTLRQLIQPLILRGTAQVIRPPAHQWRGGQQPQRPVRPR